MTPEGDAALEVLVDYLTARLHLLTMVTPRPDNPSLPAQLTARANELAQLAKYLGLTEELLRRGAPVPRL